MGCAYLVDKLKNTDIIAKIGNKNVEFVGTIGKVSEISGTHMTVFDSLFLYIPCLLRGKFRIKYGTL